MAVFPSLFLFRFNFCPNYVIPNIRVRETPRGSVPTVDYWWSTILLNHRSSAETRLRTTDHVCVDVSLLLFIRPGVGRQERDVQRAGRQGAEGKVVVLLSEFLLANCRPPQHYRGCSRTQVSNNDRLLGVHCLTIQYCCQFNLFIVCVHAGFNFEMCIIFWLNAT